MTGSTTSWLPWKKRRGVVLAASPTQSVSCKMTVNELPKEERHESPMLALGKTEAGKGWQTGAGDRKVCFPGSWTV